MKDLKRIGSTKKKMNKPVESLSKINRCIIHIPLAVNNKNDKSEISSSRDAYIVLRF